MFEEKSRPKAMAIISTSIAIGQIVGMAVAGFTNTVTPLTWRLPFLLVSIPNFIIIIIFIIIYASKSMKTAEDYLQDLNSNDQMSKKEAMSALGGLLKDERAVDPLIKILWSL